MEWFLYDKDLSYERVKNCALWSLYNIGCRKDSAQFIVWVYHRESWSNVFFLFLSQGVGDSSQFFTCIPLYLLIKSLVVVLRWFGRKHCALRSNLRATRCVQKDLNYQLSVIKLL